MSHPERINYPFPAVDRPVRHLWLLPELLVVGREDQPVSFRAGTADIQQLTAEVAAYPLSPGSGRLDLAKLKAELDADLTWTDPYWTGDY